MQTREKPLLLTVLAAAGIVLAAQILLLATANQGVLHGQLFDPDSYMHLQRALHLMQSGQSGDPRVNAPFGYAIHWTSLFDGLLAAGAAPLHWLGLSAKDALYMWGSAISPILLMLALGVFAAGLRPHLGGAAFLWLTVLFFTQPQLSGAFLAGRPDHHSLILGLLLVQLGWAIAALDGRAGAVTAIAAGAAAGVQLCTSVEGLVTILVIGVTFALAWAWLRKNVLRLLALYLAGCLATVTAWLLLTGHVTPAYDQISIVHGTVLASGLLGVAILSLSSRWKLHPVAALITAALLAAAPIALLYPDFFLGPWPHLDPVLREWHRGISELQPTLPTDLRRLGQFLAQFTAALLALPLTLHLLRHGNPAERTAMLLSFCGFCIFGVLSLAQMRWSGELQAAMLLPWTLTTIRIMQSEVALRLGRYRLPLRSFALMAALMLQVVPGTLAPARAIAPVRTDTACDWSQAARTLATLQPQQGIVLTELWYGPEILWRTNFDVVGAPYEIPPALIDSQRFSTGDLAARRAVLTRRHITHVLTCGPAPDATPLGLTPAGFATPGFHLYRTGTAARH